MSPEPNKNKEANEKPPKDVTVAFFKYNKTYNS